MSGTTKEVKGVISVLSGQERWPKDIISNRDIIRIDIACEAMEVDARKSIFNMAVAAFGQEGVSTHM